ncbi:hypothetical protein ACDZ28_00625 (plasmid) [Paenibacillus sp. RS8]|uniref:hypothetical protein n=1 Tax=Paenibacillus sp. RS8 TaxID=3242681 RepID=UPI0035C1AFA9
MFTITEIYRIVNAERLDLDWDTLVEEAFETYSKLSQSRQSEFNALVKRAISQCQADFDSFPESYQTKEDVEDLDEIIDVIKEKLETIFADFLE